MKKLKSELSSNMALASTLSKSISFLGVAQAELAMMLKISPDAMTKSLKNGIDPNKLQGRYSFMIIRVYCSLYVLLGGNKQQMAKWIRGKLVLFDKSPIDMMYDETDIVYLNEYLDSMRAKS